jgi:hypothetical protein
MERGRYFQLVLVRSRFLNSLHFSLFNSAIFKFAHACTASTDSWIRLWSFLETVSDNVVSSTYFHRLSQDVVVGAVKSLIINMYSHGPSVAPLSERYSSRRINQWLI